MFKKLKEKKDKSQWYRWFAIYPVKTIDGYFIWMKHCYKKIEISWHDFPPYKFKHKFYRFMLTGSDKCKTRKEKEEYIRQLTAKYGGRMLTLKDLDENEFEERQEEAKRMGLDPNKEW